MQEKRNSRRMSLSAKLLIKNMHDTSDKPEEIEIEVLDVSKTGDRKSTRLNSSHP